VRITFAYPWEGMLLLGTTDDLYDAEPDELEVREQDVEQVLAEAAVAVAPELLRRERVRAAFAGLRVLPVADGDTARARRETVFLEGKAGMISIAGGKLTTYRRIALSALACVGRTIDVGRLDLRPAPLPGATGIEAAARQLAERHPQLPWPTRAQLVHLYGSLATEVVALAEDRPELLRPIHPKAPEIWAQVVYAKRHEWAASADDVLWRRTTLGPRGLGTPDVVARIETLLSG
jgi:glycerol-3-phosphate dehydrogenase